MSKGEGGKGRARKKEERERERKKKNKTNLFVVSPPVHSQYPESFLMRYSQPLSWARSRSLLVVFFLWRRNRKVREDCRGFVLVLLLLPRRRRPAFSPTPTYCSATRVRFRICPRGSFASKHRASNYVCTTMESDKAPRPRMRRKAHRAQPLCMCRRGEQRLGCAALSSGKMRCLPPLISPSLPRSCSKINDTYPSGEQ